MIRSSATSAYLLSLGCMLAHAGIPICAQELHPSKDNLLGEAIQQWLEYRDFQRVLQGKWTHTSKYTYKKQAKKDTTETTRHEFKQNLECALFRRLKNESDPEAISAANSKYFFGIRYAEPNSGWVLQDLQLKGAKGANAQILSEPFLRRQIARFVAVDAFLDLQLCDVARAPTFKVIALKEEVKEGRKLARMSFSYSYLPDGKTVVPTTGSMLFDPEHYWCTLEQDFTQVYPQGKQHAVFAKEYRKTRAGMPIISRMTWHIKRESGNDSEDVFVFDIEDPSSLPENDVFTLSAFGLPEPQGIVWDRSGTRYYLWLGLAGFFLLVIGVLFRCFARARRVAKAEPPTKTTFKPA